MDYSLTYLVLVYYSLIVRSPSATLVNPVFPTNNISKGRI